MGSHANLIPTCACQHTVADPYRYVPPWILRPGSFRERREQPAQLWFLAARAVRALDQHRLDPARCRHTQSIPPRPLHRRRRPPRQHVKLAKPKWTGSVLYKPDGPNGRLQWATDRRSVYFLCALLSSWFKIRGEAGGEPQGEDSYIPRTTFGKLPR